MSKDDVLSINQKKLTRIYGLSVAAQLLDDSSKWLKALKMIEKIVEGEE